MYSANKQQADRYFKKIKKGKQESKIIKKKSGFYIHGERSKRSKEALRLVTEEIGQEEIAERDKANRAERAKNILERAAEYISAAGAPVNVPITEPFLVSSEAPCDS